MSQRSSSISWKIQVRFFTDVNLCNRKNKFGWTPLMIALGHRPGNFRPAADTMAAIERFMRAQGYIPPPKTAPEAGRRDY